MEVSKHHFSWPTFLHPEMFGPFEHLGQPLDKRLVNAVQALHYCTSSSTHY